MTNREVSTLVLRLIGFYWLVAGLIQAVSTIGALLVPMSPDMAWMHKPAFVLLIGLQALAYPAAGALLLFMARTLAGRWSSRPEELAPAIITLDAGTALLGLYFLVLGVHGVIEPLRSWIVTAQFQSYSTTTFIEAAIYSGAGALLMTRQKWLMAAISRQATNSATSQE